MNTGFSGQSNLDLSLNGTLDHLSIHANWDLTPTLLTYARFFSKPKDIPLNVDLDLLLKDQEILSGDFSVRLKDTTLKGNLKGFDLASREGQWNFITNKFSLASWEPMIPPFENYLVRVSQ